MIMLIKSVLFCFIMKVFYIINYLDFGLFSTSNTGVISDLTGSHTHFSSPFIIYKKYMHPAILRDTTFHARLLKYTGIVKPL